MIPEGSVRAVVVLNTSEPDGRFAVNLIDVPLAVMAISCGPGGPSLVHCGSNHPSASRVQEDLVRPATQSCLGEQNFRAPLVVRVCQGAVPEPIPPRIIGWDERVCNTGQPLEYPIRQGLPV